MARDPGPSSSGLAAGLCARCEHQREVRNTRGSSFSLCERSRVEPQRFARYPRLPVLACDGFEERASADTARDD